MFTREGVSCCLMDDSRFNALGRNSLGAIGVISGNGYDRFEFARVPSCVVPVFNGRYSGWALFSIVRQGWVAIRNRRAPGEGMRVAARVFSPAIFFPAFLVGWPCEQEFPGFAVPVENSFPNRASPSQSCIVLDNGDLLERRHERDCPEARLEPGAKSSMI
ncbi:hypothetical protein ACFSOZ_35230 [Mesorhizobium newzealandense]|uniref:Uncharacterized protein n=1 Tax=Mesorhizobium newzealandense TaxID=1300302 RepID=A0ABW4UKG4_9HYPH